MLRSGMWIGWLGSLALWLVCGTGAWAAARIEMEIGTQAGIPPTAMQQWYQLLTELKVDNLRIRSLDAGDKLGVVTTGTPDRPTYRVTGMLTSRSELAVPGHRFSLGDRQRLAAWLNELRQQGPEGPPTERVPFGLSVEQLQAVEQDLARAVTIDTQGQRLTTVLNTIRRDLRHPLMADQKVVDILSAAEPVGEQLRGLSAGTALAAALRPSALVLVPRRDVQGQVQYVVSASQPGQESWPVGWPPEQPGHQLVPPMYELINANIDDVPLAQVLEVVTGRLELPVLFDQQALARQGLDLAKFRVNLPARQLTYYDVLSKTLFQAGLKFELRVDEAQRPFVWITSLK
jgi:hypothetical protein